MSDAERLADMLDKLMTPDWAAFRGEILAALRSNSNAQELADSLVEARQLLIKVARLNGELTALLRTISVP